MRAEPTTLMDYQIYLVFQKIKLNKHEKPIADMATDILPEVDVEERKKGRD